MTGNRKTGIMGWSVLAAGVRLIVLPLLAIAAASVCGAGELVGLADNTWTRIADCPGDALRRDVPPGRGATWVYEPVTGKLLRFGGYTPSDSNAMDEFDPVKKTWQRLFAHDENYPADRPGGGANWMMVYDEASRKVILAGGWRSTGSTGNIGVWQYDPATRAFSKTGDGLDFRTYFAWDPVNRRVIASPGVPAYGGRGERTMVFDAARGAWEARTTKPLPQSYYSGSHPAIYDPSVKKVVLIKDDETWHYDVGANAWEKVATTGTPPKKRFPAMAYDPAHQAILRYGGSDGREHQTYIGQTWIYKAAAKTWTRLECPGIPVGTGRPGTQPLFYHLAIAYYPPQKCLLMSDPDLGVWAFRYNPAAPMGKEAVGAVPLTVGQAALNPPAEGPADVFRTYPSAPNPELLAMGDNTLLRLGHCASGDEIRFHYDTDLGVVLKYGGCGNSNSPFWSGYGNNLTVYDPGSNRWFARRTGDASGVNRPGNGCGRSAIYDSSRKIWWFFGGHSGVPYPCLPPTAVGPWSYDMLTDRFTDHQVKSTVGRGMDVGMNLVYDPENDITVVPDKGKVFIFDFKKKTWQEKAVEGGPGKLASHAGSMVWVPPLHGFLCFNKGRSLLYSPKENVWKDLQPAAAPPAREIKMGLAFDSRNGIVLLVGGYLKWNEGPVKDMWAFRPQANTWEELKPAPAREWYSDHYAGVGQTAYDSRHNVFLIAFESANRMFAYRYKK